MFVYIFLCNESRFEININCHFVKFNELEKKAKYFKLNRSYIIANTISDTK